MARRGATARVNLVKASTGSAAPLITAKTGARQIAAAPLVHAPTPTLQRTNPSLPAPVQVGGEKQAHEGLAKQTATVGNVDYQLEQDGNNYVLKDANGNVKRTYSKSQMDAIGRRGTSGATMDALDSAAYFRFSGGKTDEEKAEILRQQIRKEKNEDQIETEKRNNNEWTRRNQITQQAQQKRTETEAAGREKAAQIKAEADAAKEEAARQERERKLGRAGDMTDEDFAEFQRMGGAQYATWGYSPENQAKIDSYEKEWQDMVDSGNYSADDLQTMRGEIDARIGNVKKSVNKRTNTPDVGEQPIISQDGKFYWDNKAGNWSPLKQEQDKAADRELQEQIETRKRRESYEQSIITELMKPTTQDDPSKPAEKVTIPGMSYEDAFKEARRRSDIYYKDRQTGAGTPTPTPTPTPAPTTGDDAPLDTVKPLSDWDKFKRNK